MEPEWETRKKRSEKQGRGRRRDGTEQVEDKPHTSKEEHGGAEEVIECMKAARQRVNNHMMGPTWR
jgi:hypothetical protein